ncbi:hypothetical protein pEaSNUABM38_00101 [Erwinia phage pEa_SNUABM_38]|nr:hypothetical protein pEaSNUABM38_00101 [Erwinia phage pEa_SNUABM_38]
MKTVELTLSHLHRSEWIKQLNAMSEHYPVRKTLLDMKKKDVKIAIQVNDDNKLMAFLALIPTGVPGDCMGLCFGNAPGAAPSFAEEAMRLFDFKVLRMQVPQKHFHPEAERLGIMKNFNLLHRRLPPVGEAPEGTELISGEVFQTLSGEDIVAVRDLLTYAVGVEEKFDKLGRDHLRHYNSQHVLNRMDDLGFFALVYRVEGKVSGLITAQAGCEWVEINGLAVAQEHQRKGIGSKLVNGLIHLVKEYYDQHAAMVFTNNLPSLALFEKLGFVEESALFMKIVED